MPNWLRPLVALALKLLALFIRKEEKRVATIVFKGKTIQVADIATVANAISLAANGIAEGKSGEQILKELTPSLLTVGEDVASMFFPGAGAAIEIIAFIVANSRPMTQTETNAWMDRFGIGTQ